MAEGFLDTADLPRNEGGRCSGCDGPVDPLRAMRVAIFDDRFHYFCSVPCRTEYEPPEPDPVLFELGVDRPSAAPGHGSDPANLPLPDSVESWSPGPPLDTADETLASEPRNLSEILQGGAAGCGSLCLALSLAGSTSGALNARLSLALIGLGALLARAVLRERDPVELQPAVELGGPMLLCALALYARLSGDPETSAVLATTGVVIAAVATQQWLIRRVSRPLKVEREQIRRDLSGVATRVFGSETAPVEATEIRPGEEIIVRAGDIVPVDATVVAGDAEVAPFRGAETTEARTVGAPLTACAKIRKGTLRLVASWTGTDCAWMRLVTDPHRRADLSAPLAQLGRRGAVRGGALAALVTLGTAYLGEVDGVVAAAAGLATFSAFAGAGVAEIAAVHALSGVLRALRKGIAFRTAEAFEHAGRVTSAVFCARGTLLLGEPEVAGVESFGKHSANNVLSLLAGAEAGSTHPIGIAIQRAARDRDIVADAVRSHDRIPGLGVTAVASSGEALTSGTRGLMLRERISVASVEARINSHEAMGRSVRLIALGSRVVGMLSLQDGLRPGARAAVQYLLDVGVEPVLLSGDSRDTCEALGRAVDIEHLRPEVLPGDRGAEVTRLVDSGAVVAAIGTSPRDDASLAAANVSVVLGVAGSSWAEYHVQLASSDVRGAASAIRVAKRSRRDARLGLLAVGAPAATACLAVALGAPALLAPLATLFGTGAAVSLIRRP